MELSVWAKYLCYERYSSNNPQRRANCEYNFRVYCTLYMAKTESTINIQIFIVTFLGWLLCDTNCCVWYLYMWFFILWYFIPHWTILLKHCQSPPPKPLTITTLSSSQCCMQYSGTLGPCYNGIQAPVTLKVFRSNSKFDKNLEYSGLKYAQPITMKNCTRHDSVTVVTCATFRCDRLS